MNAIDTNVIVYLYDATAPGKQARAQQLLDDLVLKSQETVWLWQVAVEFLSCLRKAANKGKKRWQSGIQHDLAARRFFRKRSR